MPSEKIGDYEIEYSGVQLPETEEWGAYVTIYGPSSNPMHRNSLIPPQRVSVEHAFPTEHEAEEEARKVAITMLESASSTHH